VGRAASKGIKTGVVVDVDQVSEAITIAVERAEKISGYEIESAYVSVTGEHIAGLNSRGVVAINRHNQEIAQSDVERALENAKAIAIPHDREIVHVVPRGFTVDGENGVRDPVGMHGYRLEVESHIITGAATSLRNLEKCVEQAGLTVTDFVLHPLASGMAVLRESEKEMGVILADVGGGTTDIAVFINGSIWHTAVLKVGGNHITNDIVMGLRAPFAVAEDLKKRYGHALPSEVPADQIVDVTTFGDDAKGSVSRRELAAVIHDRAEEIFDLTLREVKRTGYDTLLPAGLVLCGGTAQLAGIRALGQHCLDMPVRIGTPHDLEGLVDGLSDPAYATSIGLLQWGMEYADSPRQRGAPGGNGIMQRLSGWFRGAVLPS
jgi:cell division protein FtsA